MHMYYTATSKLLQINFLYCAISTGGTYARKEITLTDNTLICKLNKNGLYINNEFIDGYTGIQASAYSNYITNFPTFTSIQVGACQGDTFSNASYSNFVIRNISE